MTHSMTGYARVVQESEQGQLTLELRAVNHRYLEISMRIPEELRQFEMALRERLQAKLGRGKLDCNVRFRSAKSSAEAVQVDENMARSILAACDQLHDWMQNSARITPLEVLAWPGVVKESQLDTAPVGRQLVALLDQAVDELIKMREQEGIRLEEMITSRLTQIAALVADVRQRRLDVLKAIREKLITRIAELDVTADEQRLEQELVFIAQKLDVAEELDRLDSHIKAVNQSLEKQEPIGRRLDFLMQEFNREANTLGSKSADSQTTQAAVELKVLIEQMREQVQNIE